MSRPRNACYDCHAAPGEQHAATCDDFPAVVPRGRGGHNKLPPREPGMCKHCRVRPVEPGIARNGKARVSCRQCADHQQALVKRNRELMARRAAARTA